MIIGRFLIAFPRHFAVPRSSRKQQLRYIAPFLAPPPPRPSLSPRPSSLQFPKSYRTCRRLGQLPFLQFSLLAVGESTARPFLWTLRGGRSRSIVGPNPPPFSSQLPIFVVRMGGTSIPSILLSSLFKTSSEDSTPAPALRVGYG